MAIKKNILKVLAAVSLLGSALLSEGCIGLGCGTAPEASIYVVDADTGAPVSAPVISEGGEKVDSSCQGPSSTDPEACESRLLYLTTEVHNLTIVASGYEPASVTVDLSGNSSVHVAVELHRAE